MNDGRWDWDTDQQDDPQAIENALRRVVHDGNHRRNTRRTMVGGGLAVLLIAAVGIGTVLDPNTSAGDRQVDLALSEAPITSAPVGPAAPSQPATAPTSDPLATRPNEIVVTKNDNAGNGSVAVLDGRSGKQIRVLYSTNHRLGQLSLSPDGKFAYFSNFNTGYDGGSLWKVAVSGGMATQVEDISYLGHVSPDGKRLVKGDFGGGPNCRITVRDLTTNKLTTVVNDDDGHSGGSFCGGDDVAWLDNERIVTTVTTYRDGSYDQVIDDRTGLYIFDVRKTDQTPAKGGTRIATRSAKAGTAFSSLTVLPDGSIYAVESCCNANGRSATTSWRMVVLDPASGNVKRVVATGFPDRLYDGTATDASGNHLIYMSNDDVRVSDYGNNPVVLASGITSAAW